MIKMRLRGLSGARDEFRLAAIVQNLKTPTLAAVAEHSSCMRRLSVSGVQSRTVGRRV